MDEQLSYHRRNSLRLDDYDYSQAGIYFITIDSWQHEMSFGNIAQDMVRLNEVGFLVQKEWERLPNRFPGIYLDEYIVMPNHIHGLLWIDDCESGEGQNKKTSLGNLIGAFKSTTTRIIRSTMSIGANTVWQRNYFDHIVRSEKELNRIRKYIQENPIRWEMEDHFLV